MKIKRNLALFLAIIMAVTSFVMVGCADDKDGPGGDKDQEQVITEISQLPDSFGGETKDFEGMEFNVLTKQDRLPTQAFNLIDMVVEDNLGDDAIITAVNERNQRLKELFNFEIVRVISSDVSGDTQTAISRRDNSYQAYRVGITAGLNLAATGAMVDFYNDVTYIDLSRDYWDATLTENLLLCGGAYIATGDIDTEDDDACWCVLFNKKLYEEETHGAAADLYAKVLEGDGKQGGWTTEYLLAVASTNYREDINVEDKWDPEYSGIGTYGLMLQNMCAPVLMQAAGQTPTKQDASLYGIVDNITGNQDFFDAFDACYKLMGGSDKDGWLLNPNQDIPTGAAADIWDTIVRGGFKRNRMMFFMSHCGTIQLIRDMDEEFGILPLPKLFETQEEYGNSIQYDNGQCYVVPSFVEVDPEADENAAYILEAMCYFSSPEYFEAMGTEDTSLNSAYHETVLKRKATRDDESMEMLDLIYGNRIFDLACALNLSSIYSTLQTQAVSVSAPTLTSATTSMVDMAASLKDLLDPLLKSMSAG